MLALLFACTSFLIDNAHGNAHGRAGEVVVAKSYDWHMGQGLVMVNKRGVERSGLTFRPGDRPATWVSRYASVTFNQYGRDLPIGGMNEAGLTVEVLWLDDTRYAAADDRPVVTELGWVQMQLDLAASAAEVAAGADKVRIQSDFARVHYLACDRGGACVAVEVLDGKTVVSTGARALANDRYRDSAARLAQHRGPTPPDGRGLPERFMRASLLARAPTGDPVAAAFGVLSSVSQGDYSQWNIVYEPGRGRVSWRTRQSRTVKSLELGRFDLSCAAPVAVLDIDEPRAGDASARFVPYARDRNRALVAESLTSMRVPDGTVERIAAHPDSDRCAAAAH